MRPRVALGAFVAVGLALALALVVVLGPEASQAPDGLDRVARDHGLAAEERPHALGELPTAGYQVDGVHGRRWSTAAAGALGVVVTFALTGGLMVVVRRRARGHHDAAPAADVLAG